MIFHKKGIWVWPRENNTNFFWFAGLNGFLKPAAQTENSPLFENPGWNWVLLKPTSFSQKTISICLGFTFEKSVLKPELLRIKFWFTKKVQGKFCKLRTESNLTRKPIPMIETRKRTVYRNKFWIWIILFELKGNWSRD